MSGNGWVLFWRGPSGNFWARTPVSANKSIRWDKLDNALVFSSKKLAEDEIRRELMASLVKAIPLDDAQVLEVMDS